MTVPQPDTSAAQRLFRQVMGRFATGVTVVTTILDDEIHGMTANAFMAGSLDPMLCVISIARTSRMNDRLKASGHFGISFLSQEQQHLSAHFAGRGFGTTNPDFVFRERTPVLKRAVAAITADIVDTAPCGDHTLFIGRIASMEAANERPLLFYAGRYARIDRFHPIEEVEPPEFW
jgi:flavin reductase (DIM6/NTAB) family NADH-FMN oxidoreductase RutF